MATDINTILSNQLPNGNSDKKSASNLPVDAVDRLADELVAEYDNPAFRKWYCGVIYQFGVPKVLEWRGRAKEGKAPARLFSTYVKAARTYKSGPGRA